MAQNTNKKIATKETKEKPVQSDKKRSREKSKDTFAVIEIAGIQLKVREGERYEVNKLDGKKGDKLEVDKVLMISEGESIKIGKPYVKDAKVILEIDSQLKGEKKTSFKYKAKSRYRRTYGYRAELTRVVVKKIK